MKDERRIWAAFISLALAWGTSFLFIKIALRTLEPFTLVSLRLLVGWLGLFIIMRLRGESLPRDLIRWRHLIVLGAFNTAIPFVLITWSESGPEGIDSSVASVLNSTVPLFSIVIAGFLLRAERVTVGRIAGLLVGFFGVVLTLSRGLGGGQGSLWAHLAVIMAAICYAFSGSYARRFLQGVSPVVIATGQLLVADLIVWTMAILFEDISQQSMSLPTAVAILWLGLLGSCLAYILYFFILGRWGATRTTLVTYLLPVVGVTVGFLVLDELLDWRLIVGGALILCGIGLVNWQPGKRVGGRLRAPT